MNDVINNQAEYWFYIMVITLLFTLSVLFIYYYMDEFDPEPKIQVFIAFIYGFFTPIFTVPLFFGFVEVIALVYDDNIVRLLSVMIFAPIIEELFKGYLLIQFFKRYAIDGPMDGLVYGIALGAGFSTIENLVYGISALLEGGFFEALRVSLLRGGFAFVGHPIYTGIFGWGIGAYKVGLTHNEFSEIKISVLLHTLWNSMFTINLFIPESVMLLQAAIIIFVILLTMSQLTRRLRIARKIELKLNESGFYDNQKKATYKIGRS